jgi:sugar lactone lactonase YvrE
LAILPGNWEENLNGSSENRDPATGLAAPPAVTCIWDGPATLGECPTWDAEAQELYWIDSLARKIWCAGEDGARARSWDLPQVIGSIGLCSGGPRNGARLIAGLAGGFAFIDLDGEVASVMPIGDPEAGMADTRLNDGKVDRAGRFWCGSMNSDFAAANASLYRLGPDLTWERADTGFTVSNGIAFSPDGRRLYFSNSREDISLQYDLDPVTGALSNRRPFADTAAYDGRIDGATVDADGNYWGALFEGGAVGCFSPAGDMIRRIDLPVSCPTMCAFGGADMATLYVTSAIFLMSEEEIAREPLAGGLLAITGLGARGIPEPRFRPAAGVEPGGSTMKKEKQEN